MNRLEMGILLEILYLIEVVKFYIGNAIWFGEKIERPWVPVVGGIVYGVLIWHFEEEYLTFHLLMYGMVTGVIYLALRGTKGKRLFRLMVVFVVICCLDEMAGIILSFGFKGNLPWRGWFDLLETVLTLSVIGLFKHWKKCQMSGATDMFKLVGRVLPAFIGFVLLCLSLGISSLVYGWKYVTSQSYQTFVDILGIASFGCLAAVISFIVYIKKINEQMEKLVETERALTQMQENYYMSMLEREEDTRRYRHDMNNHFMCLSELAKKEHAHEVMAYINGLQRQLLKIRKECYSTGNKIIDILLNHYLVDLCDVNIQVTGHCNVELEIEDISLCAVVSNMLQNAVEELERQKNHKKYLKVMFSTGKLYFKIQMRNSMTVERGSNNIKTWKKDKENHGFGIRNIEETVKKSGGYTEIIQENGEFYVGVILPIKRCDCY